MSATFPATPVPPESRPSPHLGHAFAGAWRLTYPRYLSAAHGLTLGALLLVLGLVAVAFLNPHRGVHDTQLEYVGWVVSFYLTFLVPLLAFIAGAGAMRDDLRSSTVDYVFVRPVPRLAYVVFRYVAHVVIAEVEFALALGVLVALGVARDATGIAPAILPLAGGQFLLVLAFTAFGFLCGVLTSRYIVIGLAYGAIVEIGVGQIPTQLNRISMTHQVKALLQPVIDRAGDAATAGLPDWLGGSALIAGFAVVCLALAAGLFHVRELTGAAES